MTDYEVATLSRSAKEEWFVIEPEWTEKYKTRAKDDEMRVGESRIIFSIPNDHPVMEMRLGEDFQPKWEDNGNCEMFIRLQPEWFAPNYDTFDYDLVYYTAIGVMQKKGQIKVR